MTELSDCQKCKKEERDMASDMEMVCKECGGEIVVWDFHPFFAGYCPDCDAAKLKGDVKMVMKK